MQANVTQKIQVRLSQLKSEYEQGQARLQHLDSELKALRETMLRISGAILALEEIRSECSLSTIDEPFHSMQHESQDPSTKLA